MPKTKFNEIIHNSSKLDPMKHLYGSQNENQTRPSRKLYRQGDILFKKVDSFPALDKLKEKPDKVVAEGEMTGHAHVLVNGAVFELLNSDQKLYIKADNQIKET